MKFFNTRFRIVTAPNNKYVAQLRWWWFPFWINISESKWGINTAEDDIKSCYSYINQHFKQEVVKEL